jgi:hypothetical protein
VKLRSLAALAVATLAVSASGVAHAATAGEAAKPAHEVLVDAQTAFQQAKSVSFQGTIVNDKGDRTTVNLVAGHGAGGGSLFLNGSKFDIVFVGSDVYFKGTADGWTALTGQNVAGTLFGDRWIKSTTANADFAGMAKLADMDQIGASMFSPSGTLTKGAVTQFKNQAAIPLADDGAEPGTLYVAAKGKPYPLGLARTTGQPGQLTFSKFNTAKIPHPPTSSVDFDKLQAATASAS